MLIAHYLYFGEDIYKEKTLKNITIPGRMFPFSYSSISSCTFTVSVCSVTESLPSKYWQQCRSGRLFPQRFTLEEAGSHAGAALSHATHRRIYLCSARFLGKLTSADFSIKTGTRAPGVIKHQSQEENSVLWSISAIQVPLQLTTLHGAFLLPPHSLHFSRLNAVLPHPLSVA